MMKDHTPSTRYRAVGMTKGEMTQGQVARDLGIGVATIKRWQTRDRYGETLENPKGQGRKSSMSRMAKIVMAKSAFKRHHSTQMLAKKLTAKKYPVSKSAIHRILKTCFKLKPLKPKL